MERINCLVISLAFLLFSGHSCFPRSIFHCTPHGDLCCSYMNPTGEACENGYVNSRRHPLLPVSPFLIDQWCQVSEISKVASSYFDITCLSSWCWVHFTCQVSLFSCCCFFLFFFFLPFIESSTMHPVYWIYWCKFKWMRDLLVSGIISLFESKYLLLTHEEPGNFVFFLFSCQHHNDVSWWIEWAEVQVHLLR